MTIDQLVSEARRLPRELRAELLDRLSSEMHGEAAAEVEAEWNRVALDRLAAVESGRAQAQPGEEVMARLRRHFDR